LVQIGQVEEYELFQINFGGLGPSSWTIFPNKYKFIGIDFLVDSNVIMASRTTYDLLALAGDIGGLKEVLSWVGILLVSWYTDRNSRSIMTSALFK
jgi:hypothetical protein